MADAAAGPNPVDAFLEAVAFVIDRCEGGATLVDDTGGQTRYGISKRAHPDVDIEHLTRAQAEAIYRDRYWKPIKGEALPAPVALVLFDAAVNLGTQQAIRLLQRALRVEVDGVFGAKTQAAVRGYRDVVELVVLFSEIRARLYQEIVDSRPVYRPYLRGWRTRCFRVAVEAGRWSARA
jgi:lysozyme family protein